MLNVRYVPAFEDNYIWLVGRTDRPEVVIVDPGDADPVFETLQREDLVPVAILITHHHGDHTAGVRELADRFGIPVFGPDDPRIRGIIHVVTDGGKVEIPAPGLHFEVLFTPGHTRSHVCYVGHGALFCGDTLFTGGCGRLFEGTPAQMHDSLSRLAQLPDETLVYCAHEYTLDNLRFALVAEPDNVELRKRIEDAHAQRERNLPTVPSTIALEKKTNPFMRSGDPSLRKAAEVFAKKSLSSPAEVFAVVRHWKDTID